MTDAAVNATNATSATDDPVEPVLELTEIRAGYGRIDVLHGVNLRLLPAQVYALLGPNGAGKSTTLRVASGQIVPSSGSFSLFGRAVNGVAVDALARAGVCVEVFTPATSTGLPARQRCRQSARTTPRIFGRS